MWQNVLHRHQVLATKLGTESPDVRSIGMGTMNGDWSRTIAADGVQKFRYSLLETDGGRTICDDMAA